MTSSRWIKGVCIAAFALMPMLGCASSSVAPPGSNMLAQDTGRVTAVADHDGTVSVVDSKNNKVIYSGPVHKGDQVTVDAAANQVRVGTATVSSPLNSEHTYQIYLKKS